MRNFFEQLFISLLTTMIAGFIFQTIKIGSLDIKNIFILIISYKFYIYWILLFISLIIVRKFTFKKIDKLQTPYPMVRSILMSYDKKLETNIYGFKWEILLNITDRNLEKGEVLGVDVGKINGPYCKNDYREMRISRTYFGRYKYKCPKCGYKRVILKDSWTLECEVGDEVEATYRRNRSKFSN